MCHCDPSKRTPWCPECCEHEATHFLEEEWPTGEAIEVCDLCGMSRAHSEDAGLISGWVVVEDLEADRRELALELANPLPSTISYVCACDHVMIVSVEKVDQKRDEIRACDKCGADVAWDEFTVSGPDTAPWWPGCAT